MAYVYAVVKPLRCGCIGVITVPGGPGMTVALPMASLHVQSTLQGRLASVVVRQRFDNAMAGAVTLPEVAYVWPTDENAVLCALSATTPERTITAVLKPAEVARAEYETAKAAGQFAVHAHSATTRETEVALGNVQAGWAIEVEVRYAVVLPILTGFERVAAWWLPTFLTPRFGVDTVTGRQALSPTTEIAIHVRVVRSDGCVVTASDGGATFSTRNGDTYLSFDKTGGFKSELRVTVTYPENLTDRMLVAAVPATADRPAGYALLYTGQLRFVHEEFLLDVAVVIDRSGSMYDSMGDSDDRQRRRIDAVADGLKVLASCLRPGDRVSVSEFGSAGQDRHPLPLSAWSNATKAALLAEADAMRSSDLGGTEPYTCLPAATRGLHTADVAPGRRLRAVVFFGDGDLGGRNSELFATVADAYKVHRVHTSVIAIGHGCNTDLLKRLAMQGHGIFEHVLSGKDMLKTITGMAMAARELPVHRIEVAPIYGEVKTTPVAMTTWIAQALSGELDPMPPTASTSGGAATSTAAVALSLKAPSSDAIPVATPPLAVEETAARVVPTAVYAMSPPTLRSTTTVTIALLVPERPTAVRITAVFLVADTTENVEHEHPVSVDVEVEQAELAEETPVETAALALAGTTLVSAALTAMDATNRSRAASLGALERSVTALAVQTVVSCRLTSWIAVDQQSRPVSRMDRAVLPPAALDLAVQSLFSRRITSWTDVDSHSPPATPPAVDILDPNMGGTSMQATQSRIDTAQLRLEAMQDNQSRMDAAQRRLDAALRISMETQEVGFNALASLRMQRELLDEMDEISDRGRDRSRSRERNRSSFSAGATALMGSVRRMFGSGGGAAARAQAQVSAPSASVSSASALAANPLDRFRAAVDDVDDHDKAVEAQKPASVSIGDVVGQLAALQDVAGGWPDLPDELMARLTKDLTAAGVTVPAGSDTAHTNTAMVVAWLDLQVVATGVSEYVKQQIRPMRALAKSFK